MLVTQAKPIWTTRSASGAAWFDMDQSAETAAEYQDCLTLRGGIMKVLGLQRFSLKLGQPLRRHARACRGHPRLAFWPAAAKKDVDGRDKPGHDVERGDPKRRESAVRLLVRIAVVALLGLASVTWHESARAAPFSDRDLQAKLQYCKTCHGVYGQGYHGAFPIPRLAGQKPNTSRINYGPSSSGGERTVSCSRSRMS
jgi:hypothetical protein